MLFFRLSHDFAIGFDKASYMYASGRETNNMVEKNCRKINLITKSHFGPFDFRQPSIQENTYDRAETRYSESEADT